MRTFLTVILFLPTTYWCFAQVDPCGCKDVLIEGTMALRSYSIDSESLQILEKYLLTASFEEFIKSRSTSFGASFKYIGFGADINKDEYQKKQSQLQEQYGQYGSSRLRHELLEKYGDKNILEKWSECKRECNEPVIGWLEIHDDKNLTLIIRYRPDRDMPNPIVEFSTIENGNTNRPNVKQKELLPKDYKLPIGETKIQIFRTDVNKPMTLLVSFRGINVEEYVPVFKELPKLDKALVEKPIDVKPHLTTGQVLNKNEFLKSPNGIYTLIMQEDGNLVLYKGDRYLWATFTNNQPVKTCVFQADGNLVLYDFNDKALWHSISHNKGGEIIQLQDDGNLVIYTKDKTPIWETVTYGK